jgi:CheY-like chemotaxis protein
MNSFALAVVDDLFFGVQIDTLAKKLGLAVRYASTIEAAREHARKHPRAILVDLAGGQLDTIELIAALKRDIATQGIPIFAFVPHVDVEKRARAVAAGADTVVARSGFQKELAKFLERHAGAFEAQAQENLGAEGA